MSNGFKATRTQHLYIRHPSGTYYARLHVNNKGYYICLHTKDYRQAQNKLPPVLAEARARASIEVGYNFNAQTMGELLTLYLARIDHDVSLQPNSKIYRHTCIKVLKDTWPGIADMPPRNLSTPLIMEWSKRCSDNYSKALYNNVLGSLRSILDEAVKQGLILYNPANEIKKAKIKHLVPWLPSNEQFRSLVNKIRGGRHACAHGAADLIEFMAYTGLRVGQVSLVKWSDVDRENNRIRIVPFKRSSERWMPIIPDLSKLLDFIAAGRYFKDKSRFDQGYIVSVTRCDESLHSACAALGLPRMTHHSFRHYFTTHCLESGVPIATVAMWRGDKDKGSFLLKLYTHIRDDHSQEMAKKLHF
jgi:integrase